MLSTLMEPSAQTMLELYRCRWQIELAFKRLKSLLQLGHLKKVDPEGAKAWLQGKLLIASLIETLIAVRHKRQAARAPTAPQVSTGEMGPVILVSAYVGAAAEAGGATVQPPQAQTANASLNVLGVSVSTVTSTVSATDPQGLALTYSIAQNPTIGSASVDSATGAFTYTLAGNAPTAVDSFVISVSNGTLSASSSVNVQLHSDPLLPDQWHLRNTGATAFSTTLPAAGNDLNVAPAWSAGYTGRGVKVAGLRTQITHNEVGIALIGGGVQVAFSPGRDHLQWTAIAGSRDPNMPGVAIVCGLGPQRLNPALGSGPKVRPR